MITIRFLFLLLGGNWSFLGNSSSRRVIFFLPFLFFSSHFGKRVERGVCKAASRGESEMGLCGGLLPRHHRQTVPLIQITHTHLQLLGVSKRPKDIHTRSKNPKRKPKPAGAEPLDAGDANTLRQPISFLHNRPIHNSFLLLNLALNPHSGSRDSEW